MTFNSQFLTQCLIDSSTESFSEKQETVARQTRRISFTSQLKGSKNNFNKTLTMIIMIMMKIIIVMMAMIRRNGISKKKKIGGKKRSPVERAEGQGLR